MQPIMKFLRLLLISTALALTSQVAQAITVVNLNNGAPTDILCRNFSGPDPYVQNCWLANQVGATSTDLDIVLSAFEGVAGLGFDRNNLLYEAVEGISTDGGILASAYGTTFEANGEDASIKHVAGQASVDCSVSCFLLVKDGDQLPYAYLFMLSLGWDQDPTVLLATTTGGPSWDGIEDLELKNFWTSNGSLSYAALYGPDVSEIPVPAAFWLFGTALMCFIGLSRSTRV